MQMQGLGMNRPANSRAALLSSQRHSSTLNCSVAGCSRSFHLYSVLTRCLPGGPGSLLDWEPTSGGGGGGSAPSGALLAELNKVLVPLYMFAHHTSGLLLPRPEAFEALTAGQVQIKSR